MKSYHLFEAYGVELEYMIVDRSDLSVKPVSDKVMEKVTGFITDEVIGPDISWSNELVLHVIELKTTRPAAGLNGLAEKFSEAISEINRILEEENAMLLPTAMHPLMQPESEMHLWPHGNRDIYAAYDRIFNCKGHGWANLQSVHLNLPFNGKGEFARLHTAIRIILPLLPAIAASSPIYEGVLSGLSDSRLNVYKTNQCAIPQIAGMVIPEPVLSPEEYDRVIFQPMYQAIAPLDPDSILQEEWLNSRGAIARFDRNAIEIRVIDIQECPAADLAILQATCAVLQALVEEQLSPFSLQFQQDTGKLAAILNGSIQYGEGYIIEDVTYLESLGLLPEPATAGAVWQKLLEKITIPEEAIKPLRVILSGGTLSSRIKKALGSEPNVETIQEVYRQLADCLAKNESFIPAS
ncbi:glutamate-cysteine ligase family protein [Roseivirga sp. BDSF3-8]|uniref:carboxylate-amine ligase n=1 Tax=Roseivirga sp. BDSF3-8 TaxID=3241598 RepID=UPI003531FB21